MYLRITYESKRNIKHCYSINFNNLNILECGAGAVQETGDLLQTNNCYYIEAKYDEYIELKKTNTML